MLVQGELERDPAAAFVTAAQWLALTPDELRPIPEGPVELLEQAAQVAAELGDPHGQSIVALYLATALHEEGRLGQAREVAGSALDLAGPELRPWLRMELAQLAMLRGAWGDAQTELDLADAELRSLGAAGDVVRCYLVGLRGQLLLELGLPDRAAPVFAEHRRCAEALGDAVALFNADLHETNLALATEDFEGVARKVGAILAAGGQGLGERKEAHLRMRLGLAQAEQERMDPARPRRAAEDLRTALSGGALPSFEVLPTELALAGVELRDGALDAAARHLAAARERLESWRQDDSLRPPLPEAAQLAALEARLGLARGEGGAALRARLDLLERAYDAFLEHWASTPERRGGVGFLHFVGRTEVLSDLIAVWTAVETGERGAERAMEAVVRAQALGTFARTHDLAPPSLDEVRRSLRARGNGLLVYVPGPDRSHVFALDGAGVLCRELPRESAWQPLQRRWLELLTRSPLSVRKEARGPARRRLDELGRELAAMLLPPDVLERALGWSHATLVGTELLGYLPFEALPLSDGHCLGSELALGYLPSLAVGDLLARRAGAVRAPAAGEPDVLVLAAPEVSDTVRARWPSLAELDWNARRAGSLLEAYGRGRVRVLSGTRATRAALVGLGDSARVLQIVAHGVYDPDRERPAGLVLAAGDGCNGLVRSDAVEALSVPDLVVLATCGAARGPLRRGDDGVSHLAGAFLSAGAETVLLSPIDLEYESTLTLTDAFHKGLAAGQTPAFALREARREISSNPRWEHPYYHSLLHVVGLGDRPLFPGGDAGSTTVEKLPVIPTAAVILAVAASAVLAIIRSARRQRRDSALARRRALS